MRMEVKGTFCKTLKHLKDQNMMFTVREEKKGSEERKKGTDR